MLTQLLTRGSSLAMRPPPCRKLLLIFSVSGVVLLLTIGCISKPVDDEANFPFPGGFAKPHLSGCGSSLHPGQQRAGEKNGGLLVRQPARQQILRASPNQLNGPARSNLAGNLARLNGSFMADPACSAGRADGLLPAPGPLPKALR